MEKLVTSDLGSLIKLQTSFERPVLVSRNVAYVALVDGRGFLVHSALN